MVQLWRINVVVDDPARTDESRQNLGNFAGVRGTLLLVRASTQFDGAAMLFDLEWPGDGDPCRTMGRSIVERGVAMDCPPDTEDALAEASAADRSVAEESASFHTAMAHLHRAEMQRMTVWRQRLDTTTHWAIILTTGITSFVLGSPEVPHFAVLLALAFNSLFMLLEGRRYQHLHHSKWRLGLLEGNYFAAQLSPCGATEPDWRSQLSADLQHPHFTITFGMGVRLRLRRNYLVLAYLTLAVWITKVFIHPSSPSDWNELYARLAVGELLPSWLVAASALLFMIVLTAATFTTPSQEALEHWTVLQQARRTKRPPSSLPPNS